MCGAFPTSWRRTNGSMSPVVSDNGDARKNGVVNKYGVLCKNDAMEKSGVWQNAATTSRKDSPRTGREEQQQTGQAERDEDGDEDDGDLEPSVTALVGVIGPQRKSELLECAHELRRIFSECNQPLDLDLKLCRATLSRPHG